MQVLKTFECDMLRVEVVDDNGHIVKRVYINPEEFSKERRIPCSKPCNTNCLNLVPVDTLLKEGWEVS